MPAGDQRLKQRPFRIVEITVVGTDIHGTGPNRETARIRLRGPAPNLF